MYRPLKDAPQSNRKVGKAFLAMPFVHNTSKNVVLILYIESDTFNAITAPDQEVLVKMGQEFCSLLDDFASSSTQIHGLRNFPFPPLPLIKTDQAGVYKHVQEEQKGVRGPMFEHLEGFNFETVS